MFDKEKYREAFETMSEFLDIVYEGCGQSYWIPPGFDRYFVCDMGYVFDFWKTLEDYFEEQIDPDAGKLIENLVFRENAKAYVEKYRTGS